MNMELSTDVNTHIILFLDKSKKSITKAQYDAIIEDYHDGKDGIEISGYGFVPFKPMPRIVEINEYYKTIPEKERPVEKPKELKFDFNDIKDLDYRRKSLKGAIKGLEAYIFSPRYMGTKEPVEILKSLEKKLKDAEECVKKENGNQ